MFDQKKYNKIYYAKHSKKANAESKKWRIAHPEKVIAYRNKWEAANKEKRLKLNKAWRLANPEKVKESDRKKYLKYHEKIKAKRKIRYWENREKALEYSKIWARKNPKQVRINIKRYLQTKKGKDMLKKSDKKQKAKRRQLGFIPLNKFFPNSEGHHINFEQVIYMPKELHQNIRHSLLQNRNMEKINGAAFCFLQIFGGEYDGTDRSNQERNG